ncbi:MAG: N-6 DNA methylase, partial [Terriglobia bacterium]|nr:N-6 DNA methylase [Terriglobia bacterium]
NGGLFSDDQTYELSNTDLEILSKAAALDWAHVEPAIFGTLFERSLDPSKRSQLGAHYTSREDIDLIVEPVLMAPLKRRWQEIKTQGEDLASKIAGSKGAARTKYRQKLRELLMGFAEELAAIKVLDPACGSGNFLYVALKSLLDLEKQVSVFAATNGLSGLLPKTDPTQLYGIEINVYAHELASVVVWIGYLQWQHDNGIDIGSSPILKPLTNIRRVDAVLAYDKDGKPAEPEWPQATVIVGNPPFLGGNRIRQELGDRYVEELFSVYEGRVSPFADIVCYWFEKAREQIQIGRCVRAGLLATQGIRGGANRRVLERIKASGDIFWAQSDRDWILEGANVHVSMVGFDNGTERVRMLDFAPVEAINANLTGSIDLTVAKRLSENAEICFMGPSAKGPFDIAAKTAAEMLAAPVNVNGRRNSEVVRPVASGIDLVRESRHLWTIDFGLMSEELAAQYELPFEYLRKYVFPIRSRNRRSSYAQRWWQYAEPRPGMRKALAGLSRYAATPELSKHRSFVWVEPNVLCNQQTLVFARQDDYFFGVLHSRVHEMWALRQGTALEDRPRYTPTSTFETFPLPWPPGKEPKDDPRVIGIASAAKELVEKRDLWLNPPDASADELKKRTLTNLYNQ